MTTYNVLVGVVELIDADSEEAAIDKFSRAVAATGLEVFSALGERVPLPHAIESDVPAPPPVPTTRLVFDLERQVHDILTTTVECTRAELDAAVSELFPGRSYEELDADEQYEAVATLAPGGDPDFQFAAQGECDDEGTRVTSMTVLDEAGQAVA